MGHCVVFPLYYVLPSSVAVSTDWYNFQTCEVVYRSPNTYSSILSALLHAIACIIAVQEFREEVVQVVKNKNTLACSTDDLLSLNDRVKVCTHCYICCRSIMLCTNYAQ